MFEILTVAIIVFRVGRLLPIGLTLVLLLGDVASAQPRLTYHNRGNRWEGVREGLPVAGYTIELLSFRALYEEALPTHSLPSRYRVRFFLEKEAPAFLVVREIDNKRSYWLDNIKPQTRWLSGFNNVFEWPTGDVLAHISDVKLYDLGVVVRVGNKAPASLERVAPAILYHSVAPSSIRGYELVFKANATASYRFALERTDGTPAKSLPVPRELRRWDYGVPFRVRLDVSNLEPRTYRLKVHGRVLENNDMFTQEVEFMHRPKVQ